MISRRQFVTGLGLSPLVSPWVAAVPSKPLNNMRLSIGEQTVNFTGASRTATTINGSLPAPVLRWKEGDLVTIDVSNHLTQMSAIHWHGIILPANMDGVPGLSFNGIAPGRSYRYQFTLNQSGTYWYHSHAGFQEQTGVYGAIVIDPKDGDSHRVDRDYVVLLSDWSDEKPHRILQNLRKNSHFYNRSKRTLGDIRNDIAMKGRRQTLQDRRMWNQMRMQDSDISDVTGFTYTYLMNGATPAVGWEALFNKGERIKLRFINASVMTFFDLRIPGLDMKVIASDGQNLHPVTVDDIRLGAAETVDVIVEPTDASPYAIFAQAIDRSGYAIGHLTPSTGQKAEAPILDPVPRLTHVDMGMSSHKGERGHHEGHGHHGGHHGHHRQSSANRLEKLPPNIDMRAESPQYRLDDPGVGLRHLAAEGRKVLTYADMARLDPINPKDPDREITMHLTGNMERYLWSIDGVPYHDADPLLWSYGERIRITFVNDTMMNHPMHLHGMWSELETGHDHLPMKHTVVVQPGAKISYQVQVDAYGKWAYHCHMLYHMMDMFREVHVT
ncbi:MAG: copper resistance system multicopper oxidase [Pseudomonadales bacterium]|nr:copper resistance system multicopper oxidase [Pseudomonadales bacterium]MBO6594684.1 copper resistance system multicopper oxidase [Pseudomonadales bacterium]MBO6821757.1 copper resistance system multicopper oxidase [Pseudomonadales bacterium]